MRKLKLSTFLAGALSTVLLLGACSSETGTTTEGGESEKTDKVVVGVYGGDWEKNIRPSIEAFAEEAGIDVEIVAGADSEWFTKLKASNGKNPQYDLLILQPDTIQRAVAAKLIQPIDAEKAPNTADLYPSIQERLTIDGEQYAAGFSIGQLGLAYRKDLVPAEPTAWLDLWNPEYKGHVAVSSPTYSAGLQFLSGLINAQGGEESNPEDVDQAFEKLGELKGNIVAYPDNPGSIQTLLERGDAWVVPFWDGRIFALQESGLDLGFAYPEEGAVAAVASWAVTTGSPNEQNAYDLLNHLSSPEVQKEFSDLTFYGMANENVEYSETLLGKIQVGEEAYSSLKWVDYETATQQLGDWTNRWTEVLGGN
ncbi:PotD/PotF family extracellular solute-binding protein [Planomicrobium sp. CPCC 101110]|uniref:ABC transporter substrate-binding protein n=1 Tax=Planomicrobium sp. CPCC 101110 TaxID=2599619 RepID=UPI0011B799C3|nr:ABC transporter substrate-binding protein [Planomicrobium sp. CPCC 101110]TWT25782.1 ABC transporter substrate-binding protein [Planomicrobium sp. CPCC 101110]